MSRSAWTTIRPDLEEERDGARAAFAVVERGLAAPSDQPVDDVLAALGNQLTESLPQLSTLPRPGRA